MAEGEMRGVTACDGGSSAQRRLVLERRKTLQKY